MELKLTNNQIKQERLKCARDPIYFIKNYVKISHQKKGLIHFKLFDFQEKLINSYQTNRFNIILKARQLGISTLSAAYALHMMMFHQHKYILILATKQKTAANLLRKIQFMYKDLPEWLQFSKVITDNRQTFELENGSKAEASSTSPDAGRSEALSLLIVDECAHVSGMELLWPALRPTLLTGGSCILITTPNGAHGWYYDMYMDALNKKNDFAISKLMWFVHPDRDEAWFENEIKDMKPHEIAQELLCEFTTSGTGVFEPAIISKIQSEIKEPIQITGFDDGLWLWEPYNPAHSYVVGCDVSRGDGEDYQAMQVIDVDTMTVVAEYMGKIKREFFSSLIFSTGRDYGKALVVIENNTFGYGVLEDLENMNYPNIFYSDREYNYVKSYYAKTREDVVLGLQTNTKTRPIMLDNFESMLRKGQLKIKSTRILREMETFVWKNGKPQAAKNAHDDLIMALVLAAWAANTVFDINIKEMEHTIQSVLSIQTSRTQFNSQLLSKTPIQKSIEVDLEYRKKYGWIYAG